MTDAHDHLQVILDAWRGLDPWTRNHTAEVAPVLVDALNAADSWDTEALAATSTSTAQEVHEAKTILRGAVPFRLALRAAEESGQKLHDVAATLRDLGRQT